MKELDYVGTLLAKITGNNIDNCLRKCKCIKAYIFEKKKLLKESWGDISFSVCFDDE